jgi:hypothetical protein
MQLLELAFIAVLTASVGLGCNGRDTPLSSDQQGVSDSRATEGVRGRVTAPDGHPVVNVLVQPKSLDEPRNRIPEMAVMTDQSGGYLWPLLPGAYELTVSAEGYRAASKQVTVRPETLATLDFVLEPLP